MEFLHNQINLNKLLINSIIQQCAPPLKAAQSTALLWPQQGSSSWCWLKVSVLCWCLLNIQNKNKENQAVESVESRIALFLIFLSHIYCLNSTFIFLTHSRNSSVGDVNLLLQDAVVSADRQQSVEKFNFSYFFFIIFDSYKIDIKCKCYCCVKLKRNFTQKIILHALINYLCMKFEWGSLQSII